MWIHSAQIDACACARAHACGRADQSACLRLPRTTSSRGPNSVAGFREATIRYIYATQLRWSESSPDTRAHTRTHTHAHACAHTHMHTLPGQHPGAQGLSLVRDADGREFLLRKSVEPRAALCRQLLGNSSPARSSPLHVGRERREPGHPPQTVDPVFLSSF